MDTDRALARSIASLISTPKRRKLQPVASNDAAGQSPEKVEAVSKAPQLDEQGVILSKLFAGLEDILVLFSKRGRRAAVEGEAGVRADVEAHTRRDLSAERLGQILALAGGMLEANWIGAGSSASLELVQRAEDGDARPPTLDEQAERRARFDAALVAAANSGKLPSKELPPRPPSPWAEEVQGSSFRATSSSAPAEGASAMDGAKSHSVSRPVQRQSMEERIAALRDRMLARNEADKKLAMQQAALRDLEIRSARCEDAMALHSILEQLFARGRGEDSAASEVELLSAATSCCYSAQFRRPMDHEVARAALACLTSKSGEWYRVEAAVHSRTVGSFLRRLAGGCSKRAMEALKCELKDLKEQHRKVSDGTLVVPLGRTPAAAPAAPVMPAAPAAAAPEAVMAREPAAGRIEASPKRRAQPAPRAGGAAEARPAPARGAAPAAPSAAPAARKRPAEPAAPSPAAATLAGRKRTADASRGPAIKAAPAAASPKAQGRAAAAREAAAAAAEARAAAKAAPPPSEPPARRRRGPATAAAKAAALAAELRAAERETAKAMAVAATMPGPVTRRRLRLKLGLDEC